MALNPFPDYAVTRLAVGEETGATVVTAPIAKGRELVETYLRRLAVPNSQMGTTAALCAVRGDYGSGKTHLLNDVAAHVQRECANRVAPSMVRVTCIEADPLSWFRTQIGPQLDKLPLYDIALELYGRAGKTVASATLLTESAAEVLDKAPARIRELIRSNHLSVDEVGREFDKQLGEICKDYDATVRRVLSRLVSSETDAPAREWIRGETLTDHKAELLGVPKSIDSAEGASGVVGAVVALHKSVGRPFVMLVDEFEHFVRYDQSHGASANVTWLKRLLEQLGSAGALALVAGHWSAWQTTKDYLDRFPQFAPIDLVKLETADVQHILRDRLSGEAAQRSQAHAHVIATVTDGNMRRVMSLCNLLFRQSAGFTTDLTERQIHEAWTSVAQRISQEQALEQIVDMLTPQGFDVKTTGASFGSIPFDLVAHRGDGRVIVVQAKHSMTAGDHYDAARKFIDKLTTVGSLAPGLVGMFLANGSIDDELLGILRDSGISNLRWFDLTDREAMEKIRLALATVGGPSARTMDVAPTGGGSAALARAVSPTNVASDTDSEAAQLRALNAELERKLRELDDRRSQETEALLQRLEKLSDQTSSSRDATVYRETRVNPEREYASYEAMLEEPGLSRKLRYVGSWVQIGVALIAFGLFGFLSSGTLAEIYAPSSLYVEVIAGLYGIMAAIAGVWVMWRGYTQVADYFEFSRQTLRDLYLRDVPIDSLARVNTILRQVIDRNGARRGRQEAISRLLALDGLPAAARAYFHELSH